MQDTIMEMLRSIYNNQEVQWILFLALANLITGVVASLRQGDFTLTRVADWLGNRVLPLIVAYGVAAGLAYVNPSVDWLRVAASGSLIAAMFGYVLKNIRDFGVEAAEPAEKHA